MMFCLYNFGIDNGYMCMNPHCICDSFYPEQLIRTTGCTKWIGFKNSFLNTQLVAPLDIFMEIVVRVVMPKEFK